MGGPPRPATRQRRAILGELVITWAVLGAQPALAARLAVTKERALDRLVADPSPGRASPGVSILAVAANLVSWLQPVLAFEGGVEAP